MSELEKIIAEKYDRKVVRVGIYKITSPTGRIYIGQSRDIRRRWTYYINLKCKAQPKLYRSFLKYGVKNHEFSILEECSLENLNNLEIYWGKFYNSTSKENLNLVIGNNLLSEDVSKRFRKPVLQYTLEGEFIKEWESVAEASRNLGILETSIQKCCKGIRYRSKQFIFRFKENNKVEGLNKGPVHSIVMQYTIDGEFVKEWESASEAARYLKVNSRGISSCCNREQATAHGFIWRFKNRDDESKNSPPVQRRRILQFSKNGEFIKEWPSISEAQRTLPNCKNIQKVASGERPTCGGFIWKYKD
jgi:hypothetical protein